ncbi:sensor histidine kinase [Clostridium sp. MCC353]|uniref:sensor histidine kinase n=1 Tax=Clostridium sp. MCC353 TaxID=2592646 RepID=UPI001C039469|nr:HAMP domain-containing sensor histidine kinase [Clostridium sp. MCC353]MBT9779948.1 sensor histidine kinase [Clostridium sp. MCC353]
MKHSGYRAIFHIYLIFFLSLLGTILLAAALFFLSITVQKPDGSTARSDWPKVFAEDFKKQITFSGSSPQVKQKGLDLLKENKVGIQILTASGHEVFSYQKPEQVPAEYSAVELIQLLQTGSAKYGSTTALAEIISDSGKDYAVLLYFPVNVTKVTMYLNGQRFTGGKNLILPVLAVLFTTVLISGVVYGFWTAGAIKRISASIQEIPLRSYYPVEDHGPFHDLYDSLNTLDEEIRAGDQLKAQTERLREEWIANMTHDLKTPLSPIKGYAELLSVSDVKEEEQSRRYANIILKNALYMESLIDDLKLVYQLKNGILPLNLEEQNMVRFLKELVIDILNTPEYEGRTIHFNCAADTISYVFDRTLMTRAFRNLIFNSFVHGGENTEVTLRIISSGASLKICVSDDGKGMTEETVKHLFDRYYRGTCSGQMPKGTGLGLAIAKNIVELHHGSISVSSALSVGTEFLVELPQIKVN